MSVQPMLLTDAATKHGRTASEVLAMLDNGEVRAACMLGGPYDGTWYAGAPSRRLNPSCGHQHVEPGVAALPWGVVQPFVIDRRFVQVVISCGQLFQQLNGPPKRRMVTRAESVESPPTVGTEAGIPLGLPAEIELADGRKVAGLWCWMHRDLTLSELYILGEDVPKLALPAVATGPRLTENGRESLQVMLAALARLLGKTEPTFGTEADPITSEIAKDAAALLPEGLIASGTLENEINAGLKLLEPGKTTKPRKRGRRPKEDRSA